MSGTTGRKRRWAAAFGAGLSMALACANAAAEEPRGWAYPGMLGNMVFGAQGTLTQSLSSAGSSLDRGAGIGFWAQANAMRAPWSPGRTFRLTMWGSLAGGSAGFDGAIGSEGAYGLRWSEPLVQPRPDDPFAIPLDDSGDAMGETVWHALVARLGYATHISHNDRVETSLVEVPRLEIGYQILGSFALEARAHAGLVLTGQLSSADGARALSPGMGWGGRASLTGRLGTVEAGLQRIEQFESDSPGPIDIADARVCVLASKQPGATFGVCGSGRVEKTPIVRADGRVADAVSVYAGLLLGVGIH